MKILAVLAPCLLLVTLIVRPASALGVPEKLEYEVSWIGVKAGTAVQEVTAKSDGLHIVHTIRSSGLVSALFSVDDETESVISAKAEGAGRPSLYRENINEGKFQAHKEARFDFTRLAVDCRDLLQKTGKSDAISDRTYDSLSSIYFIRSSELKPGRSIFLDIYDFKHLWETEVRVVRREEIRTPLGKFKTLMVTSQLKYKGVPARVGNVTFWLTDDNRRLPVKITSRLRVGEITLTLVGGDYRK